MQAVPIQIIIVFLPISIYFYVKFQNMANMNSCATQSGVELNYNESSCISPCNLANEIAFSSHCNLYR